MEKKNTNKLLVLIGVLVVLFIALIASVILLVGGIKKDKEADGVKVYNFEVDDNYQGKKMQNLYAACDVGKTGLYLVSVVGIDWDGNVNWELIKDFLKVQSLTITENETAWSVDSLREGLNTVIEFDKKYAASVPSKEEAAKAIRDYGSMQREKYSNDAVKNIELQMEEEYGIFAVNLGEMEEATALDIQRAVAYMFETYPQIKGTLTNITLGNFSGQDTGNIAVTQTNEFMLSGNPGQCPYVVKHEIVLNAAKFTQREKMLQDCEYQVSIGHWPKNSDISSIVVHELGHHLLDVSIMEKYGLKNAYYITEENEEAYILYSSDKLAVNQTTAKGIMEEAYRIWQEEYGHSGTQEEFRQSISDYAMGSQADGGVSFGETFAEAVADIYLNQEQAADASKSILDVVNNKKF